MDGIGNYSGSPNSELLTEPTVLKHRIDSWPCSRWGIENLSPLLGDEKIRFRIGKKFAEVSDVQYEGDCCYEEATMEDFCEWCQQHCHQNETPRSGASTSPSKCVQQSTLHVGEAMDHGKGNPLMKYDNAYHWCYADYKYMMQLFKNHSDVLEAVRWGELGFPEFDGHQSTIWVGSEGANTPCHQDSYGFNLVAQITGRKKWTLFPPDQSDRLYPTRLPYEESSVFSYVNIKSPDLSRHPKFGGATPYVVVLHPGDVLFVPKHWWHYVESLDLSISINCWMDVASDDISRIDEAIAKTLVCGLLPSLEDDNGAEEDETQSRPFWLNPTEEATSNCTNLMLLNTALKAGHARYGREPRGTAKGCKQSRNESDILKCESRCKPSRGLAADCKEERRLPRNGDDTEGDRGDPCQQLRESSPQAGEKNAGNVERMSPIGDARQLLCSVHHTINSDITECLGEKCFTLTTQGLPDDPTASESGAWRQRKRDIRDTDDVEQTCSGGPVKRNKRCDAVTVPGSQISVARQSTIAVPCLGTVTQLTASNKGNDCANLKIEEESSVPLGASLENTASVVEITMATLVECLTQPNIIALVREELMARVCLKHHATNCDN